MVVAEIPLWVMHSHHLQPQQQQQQQQQQPQSSSSSTSSSGAAAAATAAAVETAHNVWNLFQQSASKKSAIYSLDVHPAGHIFATAGGDGTVRLWNTHALFQSARDVATTATTTQTQTQTQTHLQQHQQPATNQLPQPHAGGHYNEDGTYVSTEEEEEEGEDDDNDNQNANNRSDGGPDSNPLQNGRNPTSISSSSERRPNLPNGITERATTTTTRAVNAAPYSALPTHHDSNHDDDEGETADRETLAAATEAATSGGQGIAVTDDAEAAAAAPSTTNGTANDNDNDHDHTTHTSHSSSTSDTSTSSRRPRSVHVLTNVVRRKHDGSVSHSCPTTTTTTTTAAATTTTTATTQQHHHSHHHHHHHQQHVNHQHRLLCTLSAHTGSSVLCVRFSPSGRFLASAGDDTAVCIYAPSSAQQHLQQQQSETTTTTTTTAQPPPAHHDIHHPFRVGSSTPAWVRIQLCRGHGLDVVDLAWAPDDSHLVSCSLDSQTPIIVWKCTHLLLPGNNGNNNTPHNNNSMIAQPYHILGRDIHTSTVKGVTFDPAGSYLASSGDDPAICIWRAHDDWGLEKRLDASSSGIFRQWNDSAAAATSADSTSQQSLFRRLHWSTDGAYICATNAIIKNRHVASTIAREGWSVTTTAGATSSLSSSGAAAAAHLVGHKQPIVVCRHAPYLLHVSRDHGKHTTTTTTRSKHTSSSSNNKSNKNKKSKLPQRTSSNNTTTTNNNKKKHAQASDDDTNKEDKDEDREQYNPIESDNENDDDDHDDDNNNSNNNDHDNDDDMNDDNDDEQEPDHATLLALGDRSGFITLWSTNQSRPLFKLQCSEGRCTVTDLAWGMLPSSSMSSSSSTITKKSTTGDLLLLVSLLDGQVVALRFAVPLEIGPLLTQQEQARVFQLRYGIEMDDTQSDKQLWSRLSMGSTDHHGGRSRPQWIENALQMSLEERITEQQNAEQQLAVNVRESTATTTTTTTAAAAAATSFSIKDQQEETRVQGGKKRVRPVLIPVGGVGTGSTDSPKNAANKRVKVTTMNEVATVTDPLKHAMTVAERAAALAVQKRSSLAGPDNDDDDNDAMIQQQQQQGSIMMGQGNANRPPSLTVVIPPTAASALTSIPYSTDRTYSVDLPLLDRAALDPLNLEPTTYLAECTNARKVPLGSRGPATICLDIGIRHNGRLVWKDQIPGTACSAIAASASFLVIGMVDGSVQLYATSLSVGWSCGHAYRAMPPLIFGQPLVTLQLIEKEKVHVTSTTNGGGGRERNDLSLLAVTSDGTFGVYSLYPSCKLKYKGSIVPAMTNMASGAGQLQQQAQQQQQQQQQQPSIPPPRLSRIQITDSDRLFLLLSYQNIPPTTTTMARTMTGSGASSVCRAATMTTTTFRDDLGVGGALQGFVYDRDMELWMRVADGRFALSDFYETLPSLRNNQQQQQQQNVNDSDGLTLIIDESVRMMMGGATTAHVSSSSVLRPLPHHHRQQQQQQGLSTHGRTTGAVEWDEMDWDTTAFIATRSHCEDRMACALVLGSANEFQRWLVLYARTLSRGGHCSMLRMLVDVLLGRHHRRLCTTTKRNDVVVEEIDNVDQPCDAAAGGGGYGFDDESGGLGWLSSGPTLLGLDSKVLVQTLIVPEMSKNRALQRLTNEINLEVLDATLK